MPTFTLFGALAVGVGGILVHRRKHLLDSKSLPNRLVRCYLGAANHEKRLERVPKGRNREGLNAAAIAAGAARSRNWPPV
jgi:hypothetical protein